MFSLEGSIMGAFYEVRHILVWKGFDFTNIVICINLYLLQAAGWVHIFN